MAKRAWYVAALVALVATATAVEAAPPRVKKVCNLVVDSKGDAKDFTVLQTNGMWPNIPAMDITRADLASAGNTLTGLIQVDRLAATEPTAPMGMAWRIEFNVGETILYVQALSDSNGVVAYEYGVLKNGAYTKIGGATGNFDTTANQVRVHAPLSGFVGEARLVAGTKLTKVSARAGRRTPFVPFEADRADSTSTYVVHAPSCVVVGK